MFLDRESRYNLHLPLDKPNSLMTLRVTMELKYGRDSFLFVLYLKCNFHARFTPVQNMSTPFLKAQSTPPASDNANEGIAVDVLDVTAWVTA